MVPPLRFGERFGEFARLVVRVPVEGLGQDQALRRLEPERMTSVRKIRRPARLWPPCTMPNSAACLMELVVSPPALARPITLAPEACACSRKEEKSGLGTDA